MILPRSGSVLGASALIPTCTPAAMFVPPLESTRSIAAFSAALSLVRLWKSRANESKSTTAPRSSGSIASTKSFAAVRRKPCGSFEVIEPELSSTNATSTKTTSSSPPPPPPPSSHVPASAVSVAFQFLTLKIA